jgi:hypothetical protein
MRSYICAGVAGLMLFAGTSIAFAQDVVISPDQEVVIKEYVTKQKVLPIQVLTFRYCRFDTTKYSCFE